MENTTQTQMPLVKVSAVTKKFGGFTALSNVDLVIAPGERVGLIGPNGSGKSTLVNCISGMLKIDGGSITLKADRKVAFAKGSKFLLLKPDSKMRIAGAVTMQ